MKLSDTLSGVIVALFGLAVAGYARTFPPMPGQSIGPAFFPTVAGVALVGLGLILVVSGWRQGERLTVTLEDWARRPRMVLSGALVPLALAFYAVTVDTLGFFLTATMVLVGLFLAFGVKRMQVVPIAVVVVVLLHYGFYSLLRVPLPWGLLEGVAW